MLLSVSMQNNIYNIIKMISSTTKTALSELFEMGVEYMILTQHNDNRYFIILGNTSLLFLTENLEILEAKVSY